MSEESAVSVARNLAEFCGEMAEHYAGLMAQYNPEELAFRCSPTDKVQHEALGTHYFKLRHQWLARRQRYLIQIALPEGN